MSSRGRRGGRRVGVVFPRPREDVVGARWLVTVSRCSAAAAVGLLLWQSWLLGTGGSAGGAAPTVLGCLLAVAQMGCVPVVVARLASVSDEGRMWRPFLFGVLSFATISVAAVFLEAAPRAGREGAFASRDLVLAIGSLVACGCCCLGLVEWNRARSFASDPGDRLVGFSAVLVLGALLNFLTPWVPGWPAGLPAWQSHLVLLCCAAGLGVMGTCVTVTWIGGLTRDARAWWVLAAVAVVVGAQVASLPTGAAGLPLVQTAWLLAGAVVTWCALARPSTNGPRAAHSQAVVIGALVVLIAGVLVLVLRDDVVHDATRLVTLYAGVAVLGVSLRIIRLIGDLSLLARTRQEARTDDLTGVANPRGLIAAIGESLAVSRRTTLMIIDLDRFKAVNDRHGHAVGDQLLREMTRIFATHIPGDALLARLGGDEFAVLLHDVEPPDALAVAQALVRTRTRLSVAPGRSLVVDASVGIASAGPARPNGFDGGELMRRADVAMYRAKRSGGGVGVYDGESDRLEQERMRLADDLRSALAQPGAPQLAVYFQPQIATCDGRVTGAEALVRWSHPQLGVLAPDRFVDLAEANGLMTKLTAVVLRGAAAQAARWRAAGHQIRVSVNVSTSCFGEPELLVLLDEVLAGGLDPCLLVLEITETCLMTDPERALTVSRRIAERGVGISIDDYGTGYSSLSYLNDLPATELKIDKSFTERAVTDSRTAAIVSGTVELAHRLGLRLVAEGVEGTAALAVMTDLGCDESQGYLHSPPLAADAFLQWLTTRSPSAAATAQRMRRRP